MMKVSSKWFILFFLGASATLVATESATSPAVSQYAPLADLQAQAKFFMDRIETDLADEAAYGEDQQGRVGKDASTLAAIGLLLGQHDKDHPGKASARLLIESSASLAEEATDYAAAKEAFAQVKQAIESKVQAEPVEWEPVGNLLYLMQQVPIVNNALRRSVTGRRFKREIDKSAGYAATLAAISQASMYDTDYCSDEEDEKKWRKICADMRDAAADVNRAVRAGDQETAKIGLAKLAETCDACHDDFR